MHGTKKKKLGEMLVEAGIIDDLQLRSALAHQKQWGGRLGAILLKLNLISEKKLVAFMARQFRSPVIDLARIKIETETLSLLPKTLALKVQVLPLFTATENKKDVIAVAMANPGDLAALDEIHFATRMEARPVIVSDPQLTRALDFYYSHNGIDPADSDAKSSTEFTFSDVVAITRDYLNAHKVVEEGKPKAGQSFEIGNDKDMVIGESRFGGDSPTPPEPTEDDSVIIFTGSGEQQVSLDDGYDSRTGSISDEVAAQNLDTSEVPPAPPEPNSINTDRIVRALIEILDEQGIVSKADIKRKLRSLH